MCEFVFFCMRPNVRRVPEVATEGSNLGGAKCSRVLLLDAVCQLGLQALKIIPFVTIYPLMGIQNAL